MQIYHLLKSCGFFLYASRQTYPEGNFKVWAILVRYFFVMRKILFTIKMFVLFLAIPATEPPPTSQCGKMDALLAGVATPPGFTCTVYPDCLGFHCFGSINAVILVCYFLILRNKILFWNTFAKSVLLLFLCLIWNYFTLNFKNYQSWNNGLMWYHVLWVEFICLLLKRTYFSFCYKSTANNFFLILSKYRLFLQKPNLKGSD